MSNFNNEIDEKRQERRKRRIRSQIVVYSVTLVVVAVLIVGAVKLVSVLKGMLTTAENISTNEVAEGVSDDSSLSDDLPGVISTPESSEELEEEIAEAVTKEPEIAENPAARDYVDSLSLEQKVASLFAVSPEALTGVDTAVKAGDGTRNALTSYCVSAIVYDSKNYQSDEQFKEMILGTGQMYRELYNTDIWLMQKNEKDLDKLTSYGLSMDIALNLDVTTNENSYVSSISMGTDPTVVSEMAKAELEKQKDAGLAVCVTGFVGRGEAEINPMDAPSTVDRTKEQLEECEFIPFKEVCSEGVDAIMLSNVACSGLSGDVPCSLAPEAVSYIRDEIGFDGIIFSDYLNDCAITDKYGAGEAAVMAFCAGADVLLCPADFTEAYNAVLNGVKDGTISADQLDDALMRIYSKKFS